MMKTVKASFLPAAIIIHLGMRMWMTDSYLESYDQEHAGISVMQEASSGSKEFSPTPLVFPLTRMDDKGEETNQLACLQ